MNGQRWIDVQSALAQGDSDLSESWVRVIQEGRAHGAFALVRSDGGRRRVSYTRTLYRNAQGVETAVITINRPVTGAVVSYEPSPMLAALLERRREGVMVLDEEGRVVTTNGAFCGLVGYQRHEIEGLEATAFLPGMQEALSQAAGAFAWWAGSVEALRKDGSVTSAWLNVSTAVDARRSIIGFVVRTTSPGGQEEARDQARRLRHEMRNVFTGILGNLQLITQGEAGDERLRSRLNNIQQAADKGMELLAEDV